MASKRTRSSWKNRIIAASGGTIKGRFRFPKGFWPKHSEDVKKFESSLTMHVQFTDLADMTVHSVWYSETSGYRYRSDLKHFEGKGHSQWYSTMDAGEFDPKFEQAMKKYLSGKRRF